MGVRSEQHALRDGASGTQGMYAGGQYVVDGNTVRVALPAREPSPLRNPHDPSPQGGRGRRFRPGPPQHNAPQPKAAHRISYEQQRKNAARSRTAATTVTASINLSLTILLVAAVAIVLYFGYDYLCLKSSIDMHMDSIKTLETQLENLKNENDALEGSIDTSIDLNHIYSVAVGELGMVPADQSNIIQYDKTESEYVRQYEDIPSGQ